MSDKYVIGIDLGGTNTVIGLVDVKGHILAKDDSIKTQAHPDIEEYTDSIAKVINKLAEENGCEGKLEGVGIGACHGKVSFHSVGSSRKRPVFPQRLQTMPMQLPSVK